MIKLLGRIVTLLGCIDMIAVLNQPVKGQAGIMFMIVVISIPEKRRAGALVEGSQGTLGGSQREALPFVFR